MKNLLMHFVPTTLKVAAFAFMASHANFCISQTQSPNELRVLTANSRTVQVKDGNQLVLNDWTLDPTIELDTYYSARSDEQRTITFTSDVDSIQFDVEPDREYDFVIRLQDGGACKTRISTKLRSFTRPSSVAPLKPLTIPISIERGKLHIKGKVNQSEALDLIFDTGADTCVMYPSSISKGVKLTFTGTVANAGTGGTIVRKVSDGNQLTIADATWHHESFLYVEKQADHADGIVGFSVFSNRIVEMDYDRMVMIIHESLPAHAVHFSETALTYSGSLPAVDVLMTSGDFSCNGPFILDTAGTSCMMVNQAFGNQHDLHGKLRKVGNGTARGVGSKSIRLSQLMLPGLTIAGQTLRDVPIHVEVPANGNQAAPGGVICMDVLSRFNTILDFPNKRAYFQPNTHFTEPFKVRSRAYGVLISLMLSSGLLIAIAAVFFRTRIRR